MNYPAFLLGYLAILGGAVAASVAMNRLIGLHPLCTGIAFIGSVILVSATGKWARLFNVVRNVGWFAVFRDDHTARVVLAVTGLVSIVIAIALCRELA